jgi:peroxiredoxin
MAMHPSDPYCLPDGLPVPHDDGAAAHLRGLRLPDVDLMGDDGRVVNLREVCGKRAAVFVYPATGVPGTDPAPGWDAIAGAPGCTVEALGVRQHAHQFAALGYEVLGLSSQSTAEQHEFRQRVDLPYLLLSDPARLLHQAIGLPVFAADGRIFYKRLVLVVLAGEVAQYLYPVYPPGDAALQVLALIERLG